MSSSILSAKAGIFPCPGCGQMISSDATKCRFCAAAIDPEAAAAGARSQEKVNTACNHAKLLRNAAGVMWIFFLIGLVLPVGLGFTILFFGIPIWLIVWQVKFGRLQTVDADYKRAKRDRLIALAIWAPALALELFSWTLRYIASTL